MLQSKLANYHYGNTTRQIRIVELLLIIGLASVPLLVNLPYRVNIFLSWEGGLSSIVGADTVSRLRHAYRFCVLGDSSPVLQGIWSLSDYLSKSTRC